MRVFPFAWVTAENVYRERVPWKICCHVPAAPPASERQRPPPVKPAYTTDGLTGSNRISCAVPARETVKVAPPSVDTYSAIAGAPGIAELPPPFPELPLRPAPVPIRMWLGFCGSTARPAMPRFAATAREPGRSAQCAPPSVVR